MKLYILILTCMSMRASHVEVLTSLDVSSFMNAFRCFVARRSAPKVLIMDRASNFVAAEKEIKFLHECLDKENFEKFPCKFQPPISRRKMVLLKD